MTNFDASKLADAADRGLLPMKFGAAGGGYDATLAKGKRKVPLARSRSEDAELNNAERLILGGATRDLRRNFAVAAWAIRKHLDYVSTFTFQCRCAHSRRLLKKYKKEDLQALDDEIQKFVAAASRKKYCDAGGRHSLSAMIRLAEALRTVDGDTLFLRRRDKTCQLVEGDRIKNPIGAPSDGSGLKPEDMLNIINGVLVDPDTGAAQGYCVHKRDRSGMTMKFDRLVPAAFADLHGYFDRYDQVRGISPLAAAVNQFRDLYESFDYTLAKEKVAQLFAMIITRKGAQELGIVEATTTTDDAGGEETEYSVNFGGGPVKLEMEPGDDAKFLSSENPSAESKAFWVMILMISLKALDIPMCFFDEGSSNWPGLQVAWQIYDQSASTKRDGNRELLDSWTSWRLGLGILDDEIELLPGMKITDVAWGWINKGIPWLDRLKEINANIAGIAAGMVDPQEQLISQGKDPFRVLESRAEFENYAKDLGLQLSYNAAQVPPQDPAGGANDAGDDTPDESKKK